MTSTIRLKGIERMKEKITNLIIASLRDMTDDIQSLELENPNAETHLYGRTGILDSLGLVRLLADIEGRISEEFRKEITIADDRAVSMRISPFRTVGSLADHIERLLNEEGKS